jgi:Lactoylglutathione lyase and related lyases
MISSDIGLNGIIFHHVGIIIPCIEDAIKNYSVLFGIKNISEIYTISDQKVKLCFVQTGKESNLELVEPLFDNIPLNKLLKKGLNYYHTAYKIENIEKAINLLEPMGYKFMSPFESEAFHMKKCIFCYSPDLHLFEFIEN